jgi:serine/threonine-protein kinase
MPDTNPLDTLDTNASEIRLDRFEAAWKAWRPGQPVPSWRGYLPAEGQPCSPDLVFSLVQRDIEYRVKAGLPALLAERYFEHPRLQQTDARLEAEQHVELIRREYRQRWESGQRAQRADYASAFPQHAAALSDLKPLSRCRQCGKAFPVDETWPAVDCPDCAGGPSVTGDSPPYVASATETVAAPTELDLRAYQLVEQLGRGGMGEVYRCNDPALGRDLAIKVLKAALRHDSEIERRFLREACITGSLQHPGIVPIYNLGRLADGRLHYTMRLVRGQTFADILKEEAGNPERLPSLLGIFEKICQAVAYAHSKRVIHRDLKPANVMVGRFGEVQVMDWGLAKLLTSDEDTEPRESSDEVGTVIRTESADMPSDLSRLGKVMGTPSYMSPEQAQGDWDVVDERTDVFALGAILCQILTGAPAYQGHDGGELLRRARRADLAEAMGRLDQCAADAALIELCRACLAPAREDRPRDADAVAKRVADYQTEVQERLRQAEWERVAAETRARVEQERTREALARVKAERRVRRQMLALATVVIVFVAGIGGGFWWKQWKQSRDDETVNTALAQVELLEQQAQADPLQTDKYRQVLDAARAVATLAEGASEGPRQRAETLLARLQQEEEAAQKDRELLSALLDVYYPREGPKYTSDAKGLLIAVAEPTADEQFAGAFRRWGLELDGKPVSEAAALLKTRPAVVVTAVIAALDEWASERRRQHKPNVSWRHLTNLAERLDDNPGSQRRELREILARDQLPLERALSVLSAALRPVPVPVDVPLGRDQFRLRQLAEQMDPATEPTLGLLTLARALDVAGEKSRGEHLLRAAIVARPKEVVLHYTLGQMLATQEPPRWAEAVECYGAARALRPDLGASLAKALRGSGRYDEALDLLARLVKEVPKNPDLHFQQGLALRDKGRLDEAMEAYRQAIVLNPKDAKAHNNLGNAWYHKGQLDEAMGEYRQAIVLNPEDAEIHDNLGVALADNGQLDEAMDEWRLAFTLDTKDARAHCNLAGALHFKGLQDEAMIESRRAIALNPKHALAYCTLGHALLAKGRSDEAIIEFRQAIAVDPKLPWAHFAMGQALLLQGHFAAARAFAQRALESPPPTAPLRRSAMNMLQQCDRLLALDKKLPAILQGDVPPDNSADAIALAGMCQEYKRRHVAAIRFYADAFAADAKLAGDLYQHHRYNAACSAALAAAGQGEDAHLLPDKVVTMFRRWALGWLRDDLTAYGKLAERNNPQTNHLIRRDLSRWRVNPDLASVRDPQALDRLPDNERAAWQALWGDVDDLARRVAITDTAKKK